MDDYYRQWRRPGPRAPGGAMIEEGESLDFLCGYWRIFQYVKGHRYSTDDVLTAWYATTCAPRVDRYADLGSGIGSVAMIVAWRLPGAIVRTVEAQAVSLRLARKSVQYNGIADRYMALQGDLRDAALLAGEATFDLVTGSPPYFPAGTATASVHAQAVPARIEMRGDVTDYAMAASRILAPGGVFVFVFPANDPRVESGLRDAELGLLRRRDVIFKEGEPPVIALFCAMRLGDYPQRETLIEAPLVIRRSDGSVSPEYAAVRMSFGFPPGDVAG